MIESLKGIRANESITWDRGIKLYSIPDAIAKALEIILGITNFKFVPLSESSMVAPEKSVQANIITEQDGAESKAKTCPECMENMLVYENGCQTCKNCGYTKCA